MRYYIGIDPGARGGISVIDENQKVLFLKPMSNESMVECGKYVTEITKRYDKSAFAVVEKVGAMPGQGVVSMFNFGKGAGFIEGVLQSFEIPYQLIPPSTWKKTYSLIHKTKYDSIATCKQLFVGVKLLSTVRSKKDSDGLAESLLLALYAKRMG